jgi:4-hydroxy-3-methylbut-2-en-1-yl diphosphate reductase
MFVIEAHAMGMCFGVRDALAAMRTAQEPATITVFGQLVHNPAVSRELASRGFALLEEDARDPAHIRTPVVMVTAHGISDLRRAELLATGKRVLDTTCPLVKKAHQAAVGLAQAGFFVVVVGKKQHVEVEGLTGDLPPGQFVVVERLDQVAAYPAPRIGIIAQTTSVERDVGEIVARVRQANPASEVRFVNTICMPTRARQQALEGLLGQVDVLVVVGGCHSNNTRQLVTRARQAGVRTVHIEEAAELDPDMFWPGEIVGLTAGTSTLPETIARVKSRLVQIHANVTRASSPASADGPFDPPPHVPGAEPCCPVIAA